jgi:cell division protein FtsB
MRLLFLVLLVLVGLIQYPLWLGKGGWFKVWDLQNQVVAQRATNEGLRARNAALSAEVQDLRTGTGALEERARGELGMMKDAEVFVQIVPRDAQAAAGSSSGAAIVSGANPAAAVHAANKGKVSAEPEQPKPAAQPQPKTASKPESKTASKPQSKPESKPH